MDRPSTQPLHQEITATGLALHVIPGRFIERAAPDQVACPQLTPVLTSEVSDSPLKLGNKRDHRENSEPDPIPGDRLGLDASQPVRRWKR